MADSRLHRLFLTIQDRFREMRRAFREFLTLPTLIIVLFIALAVGAYLFERSSYKFTSPIYSFFQARVFVNAESTSDLLGNIAGSIITVTSITITLLLLIVQQSASNLTTQVFDQFLRRRSNQFFFGFFVGVAVFSLITLATVDEPFNPVFSASLVFLFTVIALFLLIVLFYMTIHQMRPPVILGAIHDHTLAARAHQRALIARTQRQSQSSAPFSYPVLSDHHGFVTDINLDELESAMKEHPGVDEIILFVSIGSFVAYQDCIAAVKTSQEGNFDDQIGTIRDAVTLERSRNLDSDPAYGVTQLEQIAWSVLSPSKSNLAPGLQAIYLLRDLLSRWAEEAKQPLDREKLPIIYNDDVISNLLHTFTSLAIIASETKQHQTMIAILETFLHLYDQLPDDWKDDANQAISEILSVIDQFVITAQFRVVLEKFSEELRKNHQNETANWIKSYLGTAGTLLKTEQF